MAASLSGMSSGAPASGITRLRQPIGALALIAIGFFAARLIHTGAPSGTGALPSSVTAPTDEVSLVQRSHKAKITATTDKPSKHRSLVAVQSADAPYFKAVATHWFDGAQGEGMIDAQDLDLMRIIEEPEQIVEAIFDFYESRGFQPTRDEREKMLNL